MALGSVQLLRLYYIQQFRPILLPEKDAVTCCDFGGYLRDEWRIVTAQAADSSLFINLTMFTVKATYRQETRKIKFTDESFFPSYDQLYHQVCNNLLNTPSRVAYLASLLF